MFETLDGYTVTKNPATGYYEVAQLSADGNALEPAPDARRPRWTARAAGVPRGLRVRREAAHGARPRVGAARVAAAAASSAARSGAQQMRTMRAMAAAGGPLLAPPQRQTVGDFVGLCLLIDFSDAPGDDRARRGRALLQPAGLHRLRQQRLGVATTSSPTRSGRCRYTNIVAPYYRAQHPKTYYTDEPSRSRSAPTS